MIQYAPMGSICTPSNTGRGSTEETDFIQWVHGWEPHIHELFCISLDNIAREVHPTSQVDFIDGTVREFLTN